MRYSVALPTGDNEISEYAVDWRVRFVDATPDPQVDLIASIDANPAPQIHPTQAQATTSLAIRMDARVALDLYRRIALVAKHEGWPLPPPP